MVISEAPQFSCEEEITIMSLVLQMVTPRAGSGTPAQAQRHLHRFSDTCTGSVTPAQVQHCRAGCVSGQTWLRGAVPKRGVGTEARGAGARGTCAASPERTGRPRGRAGGRSHGQRQRSSGSWAGVAQSSVNVEPAASLRAQQHSPCPLLQTLTDPRAEGISSSSPTSPSSFSCPGLQPVPRDPASSKELLGRGGCGVPVWFPRLQLPPAASQLGLDTAQPTCQHGLLAALALPDPVGKHGGTAAKAVPGALETSTKPCHLSQVSHRASCDPGSPRGAESSSCGGPKQLIPSPREPRALQRCWAGGHRPGQPPPPPLCAAPLAASFLPSGPFVPDIVPDTVPATPRAPSLPLQQGRGWDRAGKLRTRSVVSGEEVTTGDTRAFLPDTARAAELQVLLINSFCDAH
ncbi:uncharacterized protein LOC120505549 [Passer montanus]|uniref:uncharacterized protein LOC120505549 n=1 Tax=Passer montanus TaxID=9160 RepID=UPI00196204B4|nr:uncharacterized protein LOC120505549 [Passer montanus]